MAAGAGLGLANTLATAGGDSFASMPGPQRAAALLLMLGEEEGAPIWQMLEEEDDSWEGWLPLHNASRWGASKSAVSAAVKAYPEGAKVASKGGYEPLHLCCMGGHVEAVEAIVAVYPEGVLKQDSHGRTPLDEAREGSSPAHEAIVQLLLELPGVAAADEAEEALRAARAAELMRSEDSDSESTAAVNSGVPTPASVLEEAAGWWGFLLAG